MIMKLAYKAVLGALALGGAKFILYLTDFWNDDNSFIKAFPGIVTAMILVFLYGWAISIIANFIEKGED